MSPWGFLFDCIERSNEFRFRERLFPEVFSNYNISILLFFKKHIHSADLDFLHFIDMELSSFCILSSLTILLISKYLAHIVFKFKSEILSRVDKHFSVYIWSYNPLLLDMLIFFWVIYMYHVCNLSLLSVVYCTEQI